MKILVIGGTGTIGKRIVEQLTNKIKRETLIL